MQDQHVLRIGEEAETTLRHVQAWKEAYEHRNLHQRRQSMTDQEVVIKVC